MDATKLYAWPDNLNNSQPQACSHSFPDLSPFQHSQYDTISDWNQEKIRGYTSTRVAYSFTSMTIMCIQTIVTAYQNIFVILSHRYESKMT